MYFHGTSKDKGMEIVRTQEFKPSTGEEQWLGDGVYFYSDKNYAFRWIALSYTGKGKRIEANKLGEIFNKYVILQVELELLPARVFSLDDDNLSSKEEFNYVYEELRNKAKKNGVDVDKITDGVVINTMFDELEYNKLYDAVEYTFIIHGKTHKHSRMGYFKEYQICVKNVDIIKNIEFCDDNMPSEEQIDFISKYQRLKFGKSGNNNYYTKRRGSYL